MLRLFLSSIFLVFYFNSHAKEQPGRAQINSWVTMLSVKDDPNLSGLIAVANEIMSLDTSVRCAAYYRLEAAAHEKSKITLIRARLLQHNLQVMEMDCHEFPPLIDVLVLALQDAYEIENEFLQYELHIRMGHLYNGIRKFDLASMHYHQLFDILHRGKLTSHHVPAKVYMELSFSLYNTQYYAASIRAGLSALKEFEGDPFPPVDTLEPFNSMLTWNVIGLAYHKLQKSDSAFIAFDNAEQVSVMIKSNFWTSLIGGNKGDVYYDLQQYDTAFHLLKIDVDTSLASAQFDNAANSLQWLARIDLKKQKPQEALRKLYQADQYLRRQPQPNYRANLYEAFSLAYTTLGRADSSGTYLNKYLHLRDSIQMEVTKSRTDILEMRMSNQDQVQQIQMLNRQKKQIAITRNFTIALVILLGCISYLWYLRQRQLMLNRQQQVLREKQLAEAQAEKAMGQLDIYRQNLIEKNALIEKWQSEQDTKVLSEDFQKRLTELTHHLILSEEDWFRFKTLFDSVYPGFFSMLRNKVPDITQAEQRMAALSKLRLTAKEAANLLGVSPNTIYKTRQRLRQRLGLEQDSDLDPYFAEANF